jgi:putative ABC transport system permease protein
VPHRRDARRFGWVEDLARDAAYAWRGLRRSPLFAATAVLTLAVGIGLNTVVFTIADAVLYKAFPLVARNDRLAYVTTGVGCCVSVPDFEDWRARARSFERMALVHGLPKTLAVDRGDPERIDVTEITAETFTVAGQRPILGRDFTAADERPGATPVAILRHSAWERRFARDPSIVGRIVRLDGVPTTVIGVMPRGFSFPQNQDVWIPLVRTPDVLRRDARNTWFVVGRLRGGATHADARAEMATIGRQLAAEHPQTNRGRNREPHVEDFEGFFIGRRVAVTYRIMIGAVALVLLVACANLANLLLARTLARSRELAVRMAVGAGQSRIVRQMLVESLTIAGLGAIGGWILARWGVRIYALVATGSGVSDQLLGTWFDDVLEYRMDYRVFAYMAGISAIAGVLFGLAPAVRASRFDLTHGLNQGGRHGGSSGQRAFVHLLVMAEVALALVLLGGAVGMVKGMLAALRSGATFAAEGIIAAHLDLPASRYADGETRRRFYERLQEMTSANSGVARAALTSGFPGAPRAGARRSFERAGAASVAEEERPTVTVQTVTSGYFSTLGLSLAAGRDFEPHDRTAAMPVAIVSRQFAAQQWGGEAVGERLRLFGNEGGGEWITVVGIAPDIVQSREQRPEPTVYLPLSQQPVAAMWVVARASGPPDAIAPILRDVVRALDAELPMVNRPAPLTDRLAGAYRYRAVMAGLFGIFAGIAVLLASLGLYAVVAQAVQARTREIGVRTMLGATAAQVLTLVLTDAFRAVGGGAVIGVVAWVVLGYALRATVREWSPHAADVAVAATALLFAALCGCLLPARRALAIDPAETLRAE